ncbi:hypothetical protein, partial [Burkholderia multivorans]|uniref:hypothetical protein n=1 Tax=Burkholderia multivorans TaxID=87883 RepID=UPI0028701756
NSYVNLKIATCLVRYADDRLIDQRFPNACARTTFAIVACCLWNNIVWAFATLLAFASAH